MRKSIALAASLVLTGSLALAQGPRIYTPDTPPRPDEMTLLNTTVVAIDRQAASITVTVDKRRQDGIVDRTARETFPLDPAALKSAVEVKPGSGVMLTLRGRTVVGLKMSVPVSSGPGIISTPAPTPVPRVTPAARPVPAVVATPVTPPATVVVPAAPGPVVVPPAPVPGAIISPSPMGTPFPTPVPVPTPLSPGTPKPVGTPRPVGSPPAVGTPKPVLVPTDPPPTTLPSPSPTPTPPPF
ncbi:MAG TPA: hypothetical protein VFK43_14630 [Acidimicrobiales bacterium]|nr:hypothetical protein [Acidimicrobiales bacterium]